MADFIDWFSASKISGCNLVIRKNCFGIRMIVFKCCVLLSTTEDQTDIFFIILHRFQHFFICSPHFQTIEKFLTSSISLIQALLFSTWYICPATSCLKNPSRAGLFTNAMVSWEVWPLQQREYIVKNIDFISVFLYVCTCSPCFLYQHRNLISFHASRNSSNWSTNTPRCYSNEPMLIFISPPRQYSTYIFGRVIRGNRHKYLPCYLLLLFFSQSRLIRNWNISFR